jgi:hypothetical protein
LQFYLYSELDTVSAPMRLVICKSDKSILDTQISSFVFKLMPTYLINAGWLRPWFCNSIEKCSCRPRI